MKHFTYYWNVSSIAYTQKGSREKGSLVGFFVVSLISLLNKQSMYMWFDMPWHTCDAAEIHLNARIYTSKDMQDILKDMFRMNR